MSGMWSYRAEVNRDSSNEIVGYEVIATDGSIGEVTKESADIDTGHIVVDTGFWIMEKKRLIPAGAISEIDHENEKIILSLSKEKIKEAPDYLEDRRLDDPDYKDTIDHYYQPIIG